MSEKLTSKQQKFIEYFVILNHVTNAAKAAGYSEKTAHVQGSEMLKKPKIKNAIAEQRKRLTESLQNKFLAHAEEAISVHLEVMRSHEATPQSRLNAAKDILDRAGFKAPDKSEFTGGIASKIEISFVDPD
jgi:phage terminase small subunit